MKLRSRLRTLEKRSHLRGPCPICQGRGKIALRIGTREENEARGDPEGCPFCGDVSLTVINLPSRDDDHVRAAS